MSETGDYSPAPHWSGYSFKAARASYDDHVKRSYGDAVSKKVDPNNLVPENLETDCEAPLVIVCDDTGSMGSWPATIFSKLPYLEHEGKEYLGEGMRISFCAVGDAFGDTYPLQVQPFVDGANLKDSLTKLIIEGGGGGTSEESYDLAALYYARNVSFPNAIRKPILIFVGDEGLYNFIDKGRAERWSRVKLDKSLSLEELFVELTDKYAVYIIRKPYACADNDRSPHDKRIQQQWSKLVGADHVFGLPEAERVVDVIFGILAQETGRVEYFEKELKDRQGKDKDGDHKIAVVMKSLNSILVDSKAKKDKRDGTKSVTKRKSGDGLSKSISLLD
jgi:hypothetical protein